MRAVMRLIHYDSQGPVLQLPQGHESEAEQAPNAMAASAIHCRFAKVTLIKLISNQLKHFLHSHT